MPLEWYPRLRDATVEQRSRWRLIGRGIGIHWEDLDENLSVAGILHVQKCPDRWTLPEWQEQNHNTDIARSLVRPEMERLGL